MQFKIIANVRQRGAIGAAYDHEFSVQAETILLADQAWYDKYSEDWELMHFVKVTPA
jgi:hypothetical protein